MSVSHRTLTVSSVWCCAAVRVRLSLSRRVVCSVVRIDPLTLFCELGDEASWFPTNRSYRKAMERDASSGTTYWSDAIAKEMAGLVANRTWTIVLKEDMPTGANLTALSIPTNFHFDGLTVQNPTEYLRYRIGTGS